MICLPALRPLRPSPIRPALVVVLALIPACCLARPVVAVTSPQDGAALSSSTPVRVQFRADSRRPISRVELYVDGREASFAAVQPPLLEGARNLNLDPTGLLPGPHRLTARALDTAGQTGSAEITIQASAPAPAGPDTQRPSVSIYSPAQGAVVSGKLQIRAEAFDNAGVRSALFYVDGKLHTLRMNALPLSADWDTRAVADGPHTLSVRANDLADNWGQSSDVTVIVRNQPGPPVGPSAPVGPTPTPPNTGGQPLPPVLPGGPSLPTAGPLTNPPLGTGPLVPDVPIVTIPEPVRPPITSAADPGSGEPVAVTPVAEPGTELVGGSPEPSTGSAPVEIEPAGAPPAPLMPPPAEVAAWLPGDAVTPAPEAGLGGLLTVEPAAGAPALPSDDPATALPDGALPASMVEPTVTGPAVAEPAVPGPTVPEPTLPGPTAPEPAISEPVAPDPVTEPAPAPLAPLPEPEVSPATLDGSEPLLAATPPDAPLLSVAAEPGPGLPAGEGPEVALPTVDPIATPAVPEPEPPVAVAPEDTPAGDGSVALPAGSELLQPVAVTPTPLEPSPELGLAPTPPTLEPATPVPVPEATVAEPAPSAGPLPAAPVASSDVVTPPVELYHEGPVAAVPGATLDGPPTAPEGADAPPAATAPAEGFPTVADAPRLRSARIDWDGKPGAGALRPELVDGVLMVSLKHYFDAADGAVYWFPEDKLARAVSADADLTIRIGKDRAMLNGSPHDLTRTPAVRDGRVMVPLDIVARALGLGMHYDAGTNLLRITHGPQ